MVDGLLLSMFHSSRNEKIEDEICFNINVTEGITCLKTYFLSKISCKTRIHVRIDNTSFCRKEYGPPKGKS